MTMNALQFLDEIGQSQLLGRSVEAQEAHDAVKKLMKQNSQFQWLLVRALNARTDDTPKALVEDIKAALANYDHCNAPFPGIASGGAPT